MKEECARAKKVKCAVRAYRGDGAPVVDLRAFESDEACFELREEARRDDD